VAFVALFIWALVVTKGKGFLLTGTYDEALLPQGSRAWAVIQGINTCAGLYSTVSSESRPSKLLQVTRSRATMLSSSPLLALMLLVVNIPDFSRFCRQPKSNWTQILSLPCVTCSFIREPCRHTEHVSLHRISGTIPIAVSILCAAAAKQNYDAVVFDPASLCALFDSRAARFFSAFSFFMATIVSLRARRLHA